ncbi:TOMM20-like protein 1 [Anolis carolinensis]|uniref:TOMM20-like protein 1 n=1 Tax=Anolis carolinensis TaxID=28377 RepID=UPI002F2B1D5F
MWPGRAGLWLVLGVCGLALLVYCLYFDRKRRGQPDFKRRLRERRRKENEKAKERDAKVCKLNDTAKLQDFFLQEIQLAELWLGKGEPKKSTEHLANAISVCTHPNQLLQVLEQTLPPQVFEMLLQSIPHAVQRLETALNE